MKKDDPREIERVVRPTDDVIEGKTALVDSVIYEKASRFNGIYPKSDPREIGTIVRSSDIHLDDEDKVTPRESLLKMLVEQT